jgi:hypothetical protein
MLRQGNFAVNVGQSSRTFALNVALKTFSAMIFAANAATT